MRLFLDRSLVSARRMEFDKLAFDEEELCMSLFSIFQKQEKQCQPLTTIKVGDWVTQYSAGYWK